MFYYTFFNINLLKKELVFFIFFVILYEIGIKIKRLTYPSLIYYCLISCDFNYMVEFMIKSNITIGTNLMPIMIIGRYKITVVLVNKDISCLPVQVR